MSEITEELKPFPFCGGKSRLQKMVSGHTPPEETWIVQCSTLGCYARVGTTEEEQGDAADNWNRRAALQAAEAVPVDSNETERTLSHEYVLGYEVYAYCEESEFGGKFSTHWSTPVREPIVKLFTEQQLRAALAPTPSHSLAEAQDEIIRLRALLVRCERTFDILLEPETIGGSTVFSAFAKCTEMRAAIKSALSIAREGQ